MDPKTNNGEIIFESDHSHEAEFMQNDILKVEIRAAVKRKATFHLFFRKVNFVCILRLGVSNCEDCYCKDIIGRLYIGSYLLGTLKFVCVSNAF